MKKMVKKFLYILLVAFFIMIITNCKSHNKATEVVAQSLVPDSVLATLDCNKKAFCALLQQLNINFNECYLRLVSETVVPTHKELSIWIIPKITNQEEYLAGYILLTDAEGRIISKCVKPAWEAGAFYLTDVSVDTLDFCLNKNQIMFGIRTCYGGSPQVCSGDSMKLFVQQGDKLLPVLTYNAEESIGESDSNSTGWEYTQYKTQVVVTTQQSKGFYDFALITDSQTERFNAEELDTVYSLKDSIRLYSYTGKEYKEVKKNHTAVVYLEDVNESFKKFWFCYGKSMEQAYSIYLSSQKTKEAAYLHSMLQVEMPKENLKYVVKGKVAGEENLEAGEYLTTEVTYHYDSKGCLIIDLEDEYDNRKVTITEKGGYTQLMEVMPY